MGRSARVVLVGLIVVLVSCGESTDQLPQIADTTPSTTEPVTFPWADSDDPPEGPRVAPLDCFALLPDDAVEVALGIDDLPEDERGTYGHGKRETCFKQLPDDENVYVGLEPGAPEDFAPGAQLAGVTGEPLSGVGDVARWFGGTGADGGGVSGILSVSQETSFGFLYFRISVGRPDLDSAAQQEVAKDLALAVLPRFPFVEVEQRETEWAISEPDPVDLSDVSYVNNLLVKEAEGEWSRGEGLVATLRLFAGEIDQSQVLRHSELLDYSGTGVIQLAEEYLETGSDAQMRAEIARLLDLLVLTSEELEAITEDEPATSEASTPDVPMGAFVLAQLEPGFCADSYNTDITPCMRPERSDELESKWPGRYVLLRPKSEISSDWTLEQIDAALRAMEDSAKKYETLVENRDGKVTIVLTGYHSTWTRVSGDDEHCVIQVHLWTQSLSASRFQVVIARDMAYCLIKKAFPPSQNMWWSPGLATYLSGVVDHGVDDPNMLQYSKVNFEHLRLPNALADWELVDPLLSRFETNWVFFEYLHSIMAKGKEVEGVFGLIGGLPGSLTTFAEQWHPFNEQLTDARIPDVGGGTVPYAPQATRVEITGPGEASFAAPSFGISRLHVEVIPGEFACVEYPGEGPVKTSWRPGAPGPPGGDWTEQLPDTLTGESVFLVTATPTGEPGRQPEGKLTIKVKKVVEDPEDCDKEEKDNRQKLTFLDPLDDCCDPTAFLDKRPPWA